MNKFIRIFGITLLAVVTTSCLSPSGNNLEEQRENAKLMQAQALAQFIKSDPRLKLAVDNAAGYAVVNATGVDIFLPSTESGWGVLYYKGSNSYTYTKLLSLGIGLGLGIRDFRSLYVFDAPKDIQYFLDHGWFLGAQANAAFKFDYDGAGGATAYEVAPGIKLYKLNKTAVVLHATIQGTRIWKNSDLSK
ncbi:hypothetical protein AAEX28_11895 [Lentisphaerota bacterium WC36G]|nr:hypothetical protein LJT99_14730 [Lentisphaerae bacterium WC36]